MQPLFEHYLLKLQRESNFKRWYKELMYKSRATICLNNFKLVRIAKVKMKEL